MPTSNQESILFLGGPQDGQRVNVERPLPATVRCYYPALQSSSFLTTGSEDPPLLHDHVIYYKRFLWFRGQEHIVYVVAGMSEHDAASMMVDRLIIVPPPPTEQPVPSTEVSQQEEPEPTYPEFILQETEVTHDFFQNPPVSVRAELVSPVFGVPADPSRLLHNMMDRRITIGGVEGVIKQCTINDAPMGGFMRTSIRVEQLPDMESYPSTGINISFPENNTTVLNSPAPKREEPEPLGQLVPLRKPGEAPKLRRINLPK